MVFSSVPAYVDPPSWNNQQGQQSRASGGDDAPPLPVGPTAAAAAAEAATGLPTSSSPAASSAAAVAAARPNSMAERARLMRMPQPEPAIKCPRCDSTNTKFCYYNNYSLSQPRHFCKTCRRYWTQGGSLRNVPVGGGCRRNKRSSKSSSSSSSGAGAGASSSSATRQLPSASTTAGGGAIAGGIISHSGLGSLSQHHHYLPFLGSMHHQPGGNNLGLAFPAGLPPLGVQHVDAVDQFPVASGGASLDQWRVHQQQPAQQQFPFLAAGGMLDLHQPRQMYQQLGLEAANRGSSGAAAFTLGQASGAGATARQEGTTMKLDDSKGQEMSLQRQYMAALRQGEGIWGGNAGGGAGDGGGNGGVNWPMNIPGFRSSSTGDDGTGLL